MNDLMRKDTADSYGLKNLQNVILNIAEWKQPAFLLQIYFSGNDAMQVDEQYPFGLLNLCPTLNHNYELLSL